MPGHTPLCASLKAPWLIVPVRVAQLLALPRKPSSVAKFVRAGMPDVGQLTRKLERKKTSLSDLCQLYRVSCLLPCIESTLRSYEGEHCELLHKRYGPTTRSSWHICGTSLWPDTATYNCKSGISEHSGFPVGASETLCHSFTLMFGPAIQ